MAIKNVIFDIGEVLVDFAWREHMRTHLGFSEEAIAVLGEKWIGAPLWQELDRGALSETEVIERAREAVPEYAAEIQRFWDNPDGIVVCREQSAPWLSSLKERGYGVYLLSNYPKSLFEIHIKDFAFVPYTDGRVVSCYEKVMKPDARIYQILLDRYSLKADECVFIDDREENIAGARAAGMHGIVFHDIEQAMSELEEMLGGDNGREGA